MPWGKRPLAVRGRAGSKGATLNSLQTVPVLQCADCLSDPGTLTESGSRKKNLKCTGER